VPDFGGIDEVLFDLSDIRALQEDVDQVQKRHRENVAAGLQAWEEAREAIGLDPNDVEGKTFFIPMAVNPTPGELVPQVALPGAPEDDQDDDDGDEPAIPEAKDMLPAMVAEVHCPKCGRWIARNVNVGAIVFCIKDKEFVVKSESIPLTVVKTVKRDEDGRIAEVTEVTA